MNPSSGVTNQGFNNDEMDRKAANLRLQRFAQKTPFEKSISMPDMKDQMPKREKVL